MLQWEFSAFSGLTLWPFCYKSSFNFLYIVQAQHIKLCILGRPIWSVFDFFLNFVEIDYKCFNKYPGYFLVWAAQGQGGNQVVRAHTKLVGIYSGINIEIGKFRKALYGKVHSRWVENKVLTTIAFSSFHFILIKFYLCIHFLTTTQNKVSNISNIPKSSLILFLVNTSPFQKRQLF